MISSGVGAACVIALGAGLGSSWLLPERSTLCSSASLDSAAPLTEKSVDHGDLRDPFIPYPVPRKDHYTYVIIGAGTSSVAAYEAIIGVQPDADVLQLCDESVSFPQGDVINEGGDEEADSDDVTGIGSDLLESYNQWRRHVTCQIPLSEANSGGEVGKSPETLVYPKNITIDAEARKITLEDATSFYFDKCLIATEGSPRKFYVLDSDRSPAEVRNSIHTLQNLADFKALEQLASEAASRGEGRKHVTVVGGGFLGSEVALALAKRGRGSGLQVTQVYAEKGPMQRLLPPYLTAYLKRRLSEAGVQPVHERIVTDLRYNAETSRAELVLQGWEKKALQTDFIVLASTHIEPNVTVARRSGLEIDRSNGGISVNGQFEAINGVYAAGGAASYYDPALGRRRIDRYDHSVNSGLLAGFNMAASAVSAANGRAVDAHSSNGLANGNGNNNAPPGPHPKTYAHQPMIRSNLKDVDICIEGVGEIDARLRTIGLWVDKSATNDTLMMEVGSPIAMPAASFRRGLVYYLRGDQVVGVLLWNTSDLLERGRDLIRSQPKIASIGQLKRQIPLAPDDWLHLEETPGTLHWGGNEVLTPPF